MTRDPRAERPFGLDHDYWTMGYNARLAVLLPQLEAADTLADAWLNGGDVGVAHAAYLAARDAHLTEGAPDD